MDGAGGGGRRYCGKSVVAVVCIFGVGGRVGVVETGRIEGGDQVSVCGTYLLYRSNFNIYHSSNVS